MKIKTLGSFDIIGEFNLEEKSISLNKWDNPETGLFVSVRFPRHGVVKDTEGNVQGYINPSPKGSVIKMNQSNGGKYFVFIYNQEEEEDYLSRRNGLVVAV